MSRQTPFSEVSRRLLDVWLKTSPDQPASPHAIYGDVLDLLSVKMRLSVIWTSGNDPLQWQLNAVRHSRFVSRILDINALFSDCKLGEFRDQTYIRTAVIPRMQEIITTQKPAIELVKSKLLGINIGYDRILLPQKNSAAPQWVISSSYAQFMLSPTPRQERLGVDDEAIIQLLIEGATAKEIATMLSMSHRTVEHRLDRMKQRFGARNVVHLTAMLISNHMGRLSSGHPPSVDSLPDPAEPEG